MEVILKEDVLPLGHEGDVVRVKRGHARNYLLPRRKAVPADAVNLKILERRKKELEERRARLKHEAEAAAERLRELTLTFEKQAGEEGRIFGQVTAQEIAEALAKQNITIDRHHIHMKEPIRNLGTHTVQLRLHAELLVPLTLEVRKVG